MNDDDDEGEFDEFSDSEEEPLEVTAAKRKRKATEHYAPPADSGKGKGKGKAAAGPELNAEARKRKKEADREAKIQQKALNVSMGLKPNGQPYKRGPYNKDKLSKAEQASQQAAANADATAKARDNMLGEITALKSKIAEKEREVLDKDKELASLRAQHAGDIKLAIANVHLEYVGKMQAQFLKGAAFASKVSGGGVYEYNEPPSGAGSSSTPM